MKAKLVTPMLYQLTQSGGFSSKPILNVNQTIKDLLDIDYNIIPGSVGQSFMAVSDADNTHIMMVGMYEDAAEAHYDMMGYANAIWMYTNTSKFKIVKIHSKHMVLDDNDYIRGYHWAADNSNQVRFQHPQAKTIVENVSPFDIEETYLQILGGHNE